LRYGFRERTYSLVGYYDGVNGHITKDLNKGISNIAYNSLNLPMRLAIANSFGGITQAWVQGIIYYLNIHLTRNEDER